MRNLCFLMLAIPWTSPCVFGQSIDISNRMGKSNSQSQPVDLVINISVDQIQNRAPAGLNVQLVDPAGRSSLGSFQTDRNGAVVIHTVAGVHQFRISGPGIEDYVETVEIVPQQLRDVENVIVASKSSGGDYGALPSIDATRFNVPDKAAKEFKAASKALEEKDYAGAKKRFANATSIYAEYSLAYNGLGVAQMSSGDTLGARVSFEKAIKIDDHFAEAFRNLARLSLADHDYEELDDLLTRSLQTEPLNAWALTYAAYAELQIQKFDLAIRHAHAAHKVPHPGLASVHIVAAHAREDTQQPAEALKEYKLYMEEDPNGRDAARAKQAIVSLSTTK